MSKRQRTRVVPLAVDGLSLLREGVRSPLGEDKAEVGRRSLGCGQGKEGLGGDHVAGIGGKLRS